MRIGFNIDRRFLGFEKKLARPTDAKAVIRRLRRSADFDGVFVDDIFVGLGVTADFLHVPAERFEHRVNKFFAKLRFVVLTSFVGVALLLKAFNKISNHTGSWHG
jgi:hypothetical protein